YYLLTINNLAYIRWKSNQEKISSICITFCSVPAWYNASTIASECRLPLPEPMGVVLLSNESSMASDWRLGFCRVVPEKELGTRAEVADVLGTPDAPAPRNWVLSTWPLSKIVA